MATNSLPEVMDIADDRRERESPQSTATGGIAVLRAILSPLASLKITVVSFALAIFLIFAGTLAQIDHDIWRVMGEYFRTFVAYIPLQVFVNLMKRLLPSLVAPTAELSGGFYFPGGFTIGLVMLGNLFFAHLLRFKMQARGTRLLGGLALITVGAFMTWLVIVSGSNKNGIEGQPMIPYTVLWRLCQWGLAAAWLIDVGVLAHSLFSHSDRPQTTRRWSAAAAALVLAIPTGLLFYLGDDAASMRILWQLMKGGFASLFLLAGCIALFYKRAGIVLLHFGVGLMMLNELVVWGLHSEGIMQIREGETINYAQDIRTLELAVVDRSASDRDHVVVVPQRFLKAGDLVQDDQLPFDVKVLQFLQNSNLRQVKSGEENLADAGQGVSFTVDEARPASGTDMGGGVDMSSAYVQFLDKQNGQSLGTHLLSLYPMFEHEQVKVGDKDYDVALQFKRDYKPYAVHLIDVRFDKYMGTSTAKNYSSDVQLIDPSRHVDRKVKIWMNNPLRYAGETLYQASFKDDPMSRKETTGLQVVTNTGWMIPYVGCMIVATGMLAHFCVVLLRFLRRQSEAADKAPAKRRRQLTSTVASPATRFAAFTTALGALLWLSTSPGFDLSLGHSFTRSGSADQMHLDDFGRLPVAYEGRMKPFDTLARNSLRMISNRDYFVDPQGKKQPAIRWLLDAIVDAPEMKEYQVVKVDNLDVQQLFGLPTNRKHFRYSISELLPKYEEFQKQVELAHEVDAPQRDEFQDAVLDLDRRLHIFGLLRVAFEPPALNPESPPKQFLETMQRQREMASRAALPLAIPPEAKDGEWQAYPFAWTVALAKVHLMGEKADTAVVDFSSIVTAYAKGDATGFNRQVAKYSKLLAERRPRDYDETKVGYEQLFNRLELFTNCGALYLLAFVLTAASWLGWRVPLNRAAFWLILLTLIVHTRALEGRIYISGRPPVTNLYSASIFIGWGAVILGLVLEWLFKQGIGNVIASVGGFATLVLAGLISAVIDQGGDSFTVLQAVLDTQFWLATHVVCITLGYATTFVAGLLGLLYVIQGIFTRALAADVRRDLARMIYGVLCFAIFFSFVGTVLGGLWADDSWGRFWGWDPKENGALIIVLWNALVLHARWDGLVKDRGMAVLAIAGNIAVAWSMFGVNQLSVGLHAYASVSGMGLALMAFWGIHALLVGLGCLPTRIWRSYRAELA